MELASKHAEAVINDALKWFTYGMIRFTYEERQQV
jgi:hypothetical protein